MEKKTAKVKEKEKPEVNFGLFYQCYGIEDLFGTVFSKLSEK